MVMLLNVYIVENLSLFNQVQSDEKVCSLTSKSVKLQVLPKIKTSCVHKKIKYKLQKLEIKTSDNLNV